MTTTRRQVLGAGALAATAVFSRPGAAVALPAQLGRPHGQEPLPTLNELGVVDLTRGGTARLSMVNAMHRFHRRLGEASTLAYRAVGATQTYLGPVIIARRGVPASVEVRNDIGRHPLARAIDTALIDDMVEDGLLPAGTNDSKRPRTTLHLHGGNTASDMDGGPLDTFQPGQSFHYRYENDQESAGLWYHDHALAITRLNVYAGLAGGYLIRDDNDRGDGGVLPPPPYEVPLILQDRMLAADGALRYPPNPDVPRRWAPEFFGDIPTVNGKVFPDLRVRRGLYRFRVFNGSNSRFYHLRLSQRSRARRFWQIGSDGGLLNAPVPLTELLLGPGERADLLIDFREMSAGSRLVLTNDARTPFPSGPVSVADGAVPLPHLMTFSVIGARGCDLPVPRTLRRRPIAPLTKAPLARTRNMSLVEVLDPDGIPQTALLNNREFGSDDYRGTPMRNGTVEQWNLINTTGDAHPIHLHYVQFQVLERQSFSASRYLRAAYPEPIVPGTGRYPPPSAESFVRGPGRPPAANERGWKDTVVAMPGEITRILVPFGVGAVHGLPFATGANHSGDYVWHCHILEHEDNEMMQRYVVA
jgi:FtsP/CotA-like multicopper oxidase with cupredoxin domain